MASPPGIDLSGGGQPRLSCLHDYCDGDQPTEAPSFQARNRQPMNHSEMKETEDLLASELNKLSLQERSKALDDVHCVGEELKETPEMIQQALTEFDQIVQTTVNRIYSIALNQNRSYVEDRSFRLKFIRANMFNVRKSVDHMMNFLGQKALFFGEEKVARDIVPADLNKEDIALMRSGLFQILKDRDRSGRVIFYHSSRGRIPADCKVETVSRVVYHVVFNIILPIPSVETKGVAAIVYDESKGDDNVPSPGLTFIAKASHFADTLPLRPSSLHICVHSSPGSLTVHNNIAHALLKGMVEGSSSRTRLHYGSDMERQYQLRGFGIPLDNFPVDKNGNIRSQIHKAWCEEYLRNVPSIDERTSHDNGDPHAAKGGILETDVLFGRGRFVQHHTGNLRFREFLDKHAEEYDRLPRYLRKGASVGYTQQLISSGTRFLRRNESNLWVVCDFDQAAEKVLQFFRTRRRRGIGGK